MLREQALRALRENLLTAEGFVRVHAAENMIRLGYQDEVIAVFHPLAENPPSDWKVGVWRVMALAVSDAQEKQGYIDKIVEVFDRSDEPTKGGIAETLGKLNYGEPRAALLELSGSTDQSVRACASWALATSGQKEDMDRLVAILDDSDETGRFVTGYACRFLGNLPAGAVERLQKAAFAEPKGSPAKVYLLSGYLAHCRGDDCAKAKELLLPLLFEGSPEGRYEATCALRYCGSREDVPALAKLLETEKGDIQIGAAEALLLILDSKTTKEHGK